MRENAGSLLLDHIGNPIVWAILALALFCFVVEFDLLLGERDTDWRRQVQVWLKAMPILLGALPLLGLLGTIAGLLSTFRSMAIVGGLDQQTLMSSGIATALVTTQLGLFMVIPGLVLFALVRRRYREVH
jgi:biopolymer transport protein ExbB